MELRQYIHAPHEDDERGFDTGERDGQTTIAEMLWHVRPAKD
jgi:hypothetical protein